MLNAQTAAPVVYSYTLSSGVTMPSDISGANLQALYAPPKGADPRLLNQTLFSPDFKSPYSEQFSFGVQRRLGNNAGFEIRYVGTRAVHQFATRNGNPKITNFTTNGFGAYIPAGLTPNVASATCTGNCVGRVVPNYGLVRIRDNSADSNYHGLQASFNTRNLLHMFTLGASYTYAKTIDNISEVFSFTGSGSIVLAQDPYNVGRGERGLSNNNIPHAFSLNLVWEAPWLKHSNKWYSYLAGGWTVSAFDVWQAGRPMTVLQSSTTANILADGALNSFIAGYDTMRPFLSNPNAPVQSVGMYLPSGLFVTCATVSTSCNSNAVGYRTLNPSDVRWIYNTIDADRILGRPFGVSRNSLTGPVFQRADIAIFKSFKIASRNDNPISLQIRAESTNAFNHPVYGVPNLNVDSGTTTTFLNPTETEVTPRRIRLGLRINF